MMNQLAQEIHKNAVEKGFWDNRSTHEAWMLIISEVTEAMEAYRDGMDLWEFRYEMPLDQYKDTGNYKPVGVPSEMADIIIRVLDTCAAWNIDIDKAIAEKMAYNEQREYMHGKKF